MGNNNRTSLWGRNNNSNNSSKNNSIQIQVSARTTKLTTINLT